MSESAQTPAATNPSATEKSARTNKSSRRPAIVAAVGAVLIVAAIGLVLRKADIGITAGDPAQPTASFVAQRDLGEAATTLTPSAAGALIDDA
jgi:hypothetical protein